MGVTTGLLIATLAFLIANRVLPLEMADRAATEVWTFHIVWIATTLHAFVRDRVAWAEQAWMIAAGSLLAVLLNAFTTSHALPMAIANGLWHTASVDLVLLASAAVATGTAVKLGRLGRHRNRLPRPTSATG